MSDNHNPPLHPTLWNCAHASDWQTDEGATLRDHFAGLAMAAALENSPRLGTEVDAAAFATAVARVSYQFADAMLVERQALRV